MPGIVIREGDSFEAALKKFKKQCEKAGILSGDQIIALDHEDTRGWRTARRLMRAAVSARLRSWS